MQDRVFLSAQPTTRRALLGALCGSLLLAGRNAQATVMRGLSLATLAQRSDHIVVGQALGAEASFVTLGGSRRIVTDVRVRVDDVVAKNDPGAEVFVRVLGGRVGHDAELVEGQAELAEGAPCVLFLRAVGAQLHWVNGMAQGHFPLRVASSGLTLLERSPRLPALLREAGSAVERLSGQELNVARALVLEALRP